MSALPLWAARASMTLSAVVCFLIVGTVRTEFLTSSPITLVAVFGSIGWFYVSYLALFFAIKASRPRDVTPAPRAATIQQPDESRTFHVEPLPGAAIPRRVPTACGSATRAARVAS